MIYFKQNNYLIEKYEVSFDEDKLRELRDRILWECSFIEHKVVVSDYGAGFKDINLVKHLSSVKVGEKEYWEETRTIYRYTYDEYVPPKLIYCIDQLLDGYSGSLNLIFNYDFSDNVSVDERINAATEAFNLIPADHIYDKKKQLDRIDNLLKSKKLNMDQKNINPYYDELIHLINLKLIDTITCDEIKRFESFFETKIFDEENVRIRI